jgi:hypothetical protein
MLIARISFPLIWERVYAMSKSLIDVLTVFHLAMSLRKPAKSLEQGISESDLTVFLPDGIFVLDPKVGTIVLKNSGLHVIKTNLSVPPLYGGDFKVDALCVLWLTLLAQVESIRFLNFPYKSYSNKLFVTESELIAKGTLPPRK